MNQNRVKVSATIGLPRLTWINADALAGADGVTIKLRDRPEKNSNHWLAHAKELRADADAARERSAARKQMADNAEATAEQLQIEAAMVSARSFSRFPGESVLEMAERHVAEADRHVEHQCGVIEVLVRDKHEKMLEHARKVLAVLEQSQKLARTHLALEREFHGDRR